MTLDGIIYSRDNFLRIGLEKTDQKQGEYIIYKKLGKVFLVREFDAPDCKGKVYYVKALRVANEKKG